MGAWSSDSRSHVSTMSDGDFRSTERSVTVGPGRLGADRARRRPTAPSPCSRTALPVLAGEVLDAAVMRRAALERFLAEQIADAKQRGVLFSVHLKATMMKVSDPIIFGHAVRAFFPRRVRRARRRARAAGVNPNDGLGALLAAIDALDDGQRAAVRDASTPPTPTARPRDGRLRPRDHQPARAQRRDHRRLDAGRDPLLGSDVERRRRAAGHQVRDPRPLLRAAVRRDASTTAASTARSIPATMGTTSNVGLMAQKAEEYGSHDKTFEIAADGTVRVVDDAGQDAARARGRGRRHLAHVPDQGRRDPGLGQARRRRAPARPARRPCSGSTRRAPTTASCWPRCVRRSRSSTRLASRSRSSTSPPRPASRSRGRARARTRSRSPATCCATT